MSIWDVLIHRVGRSVTGPMVSVDGTNRWKEENTAADGPVGRLLRALPHVGRTRLLSSASSSLASFRAILDNIVPFFLRLFSLFVDGLVARSPRGSREHSPFGVRGTRANDMHLGPHRRATHSSKPSFLLRMEDIFHGDRRGNAITTPSFAVGIGCSKLRPTGIHNGHPMSVLDGTSSYSYP
jgi:hypothetical protein